MTDAAARVPACILVTGEPALARRLEDHGVELIVAHDEAVGLAAAAAHPALPLIVDLQTLPGFPKELRRRAEGGERPGLVLGCSSPLADPAAATGEAFCDALVARPAVLRDLAGVIARAGTDAAGNP